MWRCWRIRTQLKRILDEEGPIPDRARIHLDACPTCRVWLTGQQRLIRSLTYEAHSTPLPPSPSIAASVLQTLDAQEPALASPPADHEVAHLWRLTLPTGFAIVVIAYLSHMAWEHGFGGRRPVPLNVNWASVSADVWLADATGRSIDDWQDSLHQPLEQEMDFLWVDAQNTMGVFVESFVPSKWRETSIRHEALP